MNNVDRLEKEMSFLEGLALPSEQLEPLVYDLLSHKQLLNLDIPPTQWIIGLMIPNPGLVAISGKPGSYKTFFAIWLGLRAGMGKPLFDEHDEGYFSDELERAPMGKVPTLFVEEENTKQTMKERALGFHSFTSTPVDDMFYMVDEGFKFTDERWRTELLKIIDEKGIKLLIVDPFSSVMGLENENDNAEVSRVMDLVRKEFVKRGMTVILIHHPSKGDEGVKNLRGAGDILGKCDVHLCLEVENEMEKIIRVSYQKLRVADRSRVSDFKIRLAGDSGMCDLRFRYLGIAKPQYEEDRDELVADILKFMEDGAEYTQKEIASGVQQKTNNKKFVAAWKNLIAETKIKQNIMSKLFYKYKK